jgi:hypothetical protein
MGCSCLASSSRASLVCRSDNERRRRASEPAAFELVTRPIDFDMLKAQWADTYWIRQMTAAPVDSGAKIALHFRLIASAMPQLRRRLRRWDLGSPGARAELADSLFPISRVLRQLTM